MVTWSLGKHVKPSTLSWQFNNCAQDERIYFYISDNKGKNQRRFVATARGGKGGILSVRLIRKLVLFCRCPDTSHTW